MVTRRSHQSEGLVGMVGVRLVANGIHARKQPPGRQAGHHKGIWTIIVIMVGEILEFPGTIILELIHTIVVALAVRQENLFAGCQLACEGMEDGVRRGHHLPEPIFELHQSFVDDNQSLGVFHGVVLVDLVRAFGIVLCCWLDPSNGTMQQHPFIVEEIDWLEWIIRQHDDSQEACLAFTHQRMTGGIKWTIVGGRIGKRAFASHGCMYGRLLSNANRSQF
eukprot:scaffold4042_cov165-Amphora_coffeaeformis.AAC.6